MYFDDVVEGGNLRMTIPQIGESKAISEFNSEHEYEKIGKV